MTSRAAIAAQVHADLCTGLPWIAAFGDRPCVCISCFDRQLRVQLPGDRFGPVIPVAANRNFDAAIEEIGALVGPFAAAEPLLLLGVLDGLHTFARRVRAIEVPPVVTTHGHPDRAAWASALRLGDISTALLRVA
jgi:hypothetical protein